MAGFQLERFTLDGRDNTGRVEAKNHCKRERCDVKCF